MLWRGSDGQLKIRYVAVKTSHALQMDLLLLLLVGVSPKKDREKIYPVEQRGSKRIKE
jgi:hypothetical protein